MNLYCSRCSERSKHERIPSAVTDDRLWRIDRGNHERQQKITVQLPGDDGYCKVT